MDEIIQAYKNWKWAHDHCPNKGVITTKCSHCEDLLKRSQWLISSFLQLRRLQRCREEQPLEPRVTTRVIPEWNPNAGDRLADNWSR
jgi:hypothetical protein